MQTVLTALVLLVVFGLAARDVYTLLRGDGDPCNGCSLKKNCQKFGQSK